MKKLLLLAVIIGTSFFSYAQEIRPQDDINWLKTKLAGVCLKQMQIIADAMIKYHEKNNKFPSKPSDLKGFITSPPYNNGRIAYLIFISPADDIKYDFETDGWDFADKNSSYILNGDADINKPDAILIQEKKGFLWPDKKSYVFVGGHGVTVDEKSLKKLQETGKL